MSMELYIACGDASSLPTAQVVQQAAQSHGFRFVVDDLDWKTQSGFLPMALNGKESGCEVDVLTSRDAAEAVAPFDEVGCQALVALRWGGDMAECACALVFAGSVAATMNGRIFDPQEIAEMDLATTFREAQTAFDSIT